MMSFVVITADGHYPVLADGEGEATEKVQGRYEDVRDNMTEIEGPQEPGRLCAVVPVPISAVGGAQQAADLIGDLAANTNEQNIDLAVRVSQDVAEPTGEDDYYLVSVEIRYADGSEDEARDAASGYEYYASRH